MVSCDDIIDNVTDDVIIIDIIDDDVRIRYLLNCNVFYLV